jgi:8-oxo-dGTP pyrophosphatase MutT (NUDIX family)
MMKREPIKVLKSKQIYKNNWIKVREDKIAYPNGLVSKYSVVELKGGIGVVPVSDHGEIYIVGQYRYAPKIYSWEIPKGAFSDFDSKEPPINTAKRELKEETGLSAESWKELSVVHTLLGSTNDKVYLFLATKLRDGKSKPCKTEEITVKKVTFGKFIEMVRVGEITDATSISAVLLTNSLFKIFK